MSENSGIPIFDDNDAFYKHYPKLKYYRIDWDEVEDVGILKKEDVGVYWAYYETRKRLFNNTRPHIGYEALLNIVNSP